jgi:hypothetical protein
MHDGGCYAKSHLLRAVDVAAGMGVGATTCKRRDGRPLGANFGVSNEIPIQMRSRFREGGFQ